MRKILFSVFLSLALFAFASRPSFGEDVFNFDKAYKDFVFSEDQYNSAHSDYLLARAQYQQAGTLTSQQNAKEKTVTMLQARDEVYRTYVTALRLKLSETKGVDEAIKNGLFTRIDSDVAWYKDHKDRISSAGTLSDLVSDSKEAYDHFPFTEQLAYETLATIAIGKVKVGQNKMNEILSAIKVKVEEIKNNNDYDTNIIDRWLLETENKITRSSDKLNETNGFVISLQDPKNKNKQGTYNSIITNLQDSLQFVKEANQFSTEIINAIKYTN